MAPYRGPVASQDLDESMLTLSRHSRSIPSSVFNDVTNKIFPCSHLSEGTLADMSYQGTKDYQWSHCGSSDSCQSHHGPPELDLLLQLSLSQTQTRADGNLSCEDYFRRDSEEPRNLKDDGHRVLVYNSSGPCQSSGNLETVVKDGIVAETPVLPQSIGSLQLPCLGNVRVSVDKSAECQGKRLAEESSVTEKDVKKLKAKSAKGLDEAVQAAIGLTVATAETLVIADIMNGCQTCQSFGPKAILDAALMLKRERIALGLNDFTLENLQEISSPDSKCEDLDDTVWEEEYNSLLLTDTMKKGSCGDSSSLAVMQTSERATTTLKAIEANTENTIALHPQVQCEENFGESDKVVEGTSHTKSVSNDRKGEGIRCVQAQLVAPKKDSFNSRWFGGWTGANCTEDKQPCCNQEQAERLNDNHLEFETSELSETCDVPSLADDLLKCSKDLQTKNSGPAVALLPEAEVEALSTGSCAEILLALSQASVKCSLQEPLCSFVPCSVNVKTNPSSTKPDRCNGAESSDDMITKHANLIINGLVSGDSHHTSIESHLMPEIFPTGGTKRTHVNSLRGYSTISSALEGTLQSTENQYAKQAQDKTEIQLGVNCYGKDNTVKADVSTMPPNKDGQCELILEDSLLEDSPPLIWHRSKRCRLRARRITESDLTQGKCADGVSASLPLVENYCSEPEIMNVEHCEGLKQTQKDNAQIPSCGNDPITKSLTSNKNLAVLGEQHSKMNGTGQTRQKIPGKIDAEQKVCNQSERCGTRSQLFKGISFLVTGFPASQKDLSEEVCKKIEDNGGVIMPSIPSFSNQNVQKTLLRQCTSTCHSIVIAPQKVRTLKYLYGCAAGLLIVKPNWLDEMIMKKRLLFKHKQGSKDLIFRRISAYVHGQRSYCLKLSSLIQHGGGRVVRSMRVLLQLNNVEDNLIRMVVAEHQSKLSHNVKETAQRTGLQIVSGDWIIDSLLNGRLSPLPAAAKASRALKTVTTPRGRILKKNVLMKKRLDINGDGSFEKSDIDNALLTCDEVNLSGPCISFLGQGGALPTLSSRGLMFVLDIPKKSALGKPSHKLYYKSICINGIIYSAGDVVEVRPQSGEDTEPYVAQIESFAAGHSNNVNTRSAKARPKGKHEKSCFLCCRWFYRPSDTGFPCMGNGKELYLSQHFDDSAPVHNIIRKVQMVLILGEKMLINDGEKGWKNPTGTSNTLEAANYMCRFFYDYQKESLHQLKAALIS